MEVWMWRWHRWGGFLAGGIGAILAWFAGFELVERVFHLKGETLLALLWVLLMSGTLFVVCLWRIWVTIKKERYANITRHMHSIMHQLRDIQSYLKENEHFSGDLQAHNMFLNNCRLMFCGVLDQVNAVFTSLTSNNCRSAIKLLYPLNDNLYVYTLTRDTASRKDCDKIDERRVSQNHDPLELLFAVADAMGRRRISELPAHPPTMKLGTLSRERSSGVRHERCGS